MHLTQVAFDAALPRLRARGFPAPDPDTGCYDLKAIDAWMDARSGLTSALVLGDPTVRMKERIARLGMRG